MLVDHAGPGRYFSHTVGKPQYLVFRNEPPPHIPTPPPPNTNAHRYGVALDPRPTPAGHFRVKWSFLHLAPQEESVFFQRAVQLLAVGRGILRAGGRIAEQHCLGRSYHLFMRSFCTYSVSCQRELENRWRDNMVSTIHREAGFGFLFDLIVKGKKKRGPFLNTSV